MAGFDIVANVMVEGLDTLKRLVEVTKDVADRMEKAAARLDELRDAADDAGKAVKEAGDEAEAAGDKIKEAGEEAEDAGDKARKAGKEAKKAGVDLDEAASQFRAMGEGGTFAGDMLERFSVITSGPMGAAIAGAVVGFMAFKAALAAVRFTIDTLISSVTKYIENSEGLQKSQSKLNAQFETLAATFGAAIVGGESFSGVMEAVGEVLDDLTTFIVNNADTILKFTKMLSTAAKVIIQVMLGVVQGLVAPITIMADGIMITINKLLAFVARAHMEAVEFAMALPDAFRSAIGMTDDQLQRIYALANRRAGEAGRAASAAFSDGYTVNMAKAVGAVNQAVTKIDAAMQRLTPITERVTVKPEGDAAAGPGEFSTSVGAGAGIPLFAIQMATMQTAIQAMRVAAVESIDAEVQKTTRVRQEAMATAAAQGEQLDELRTKAADLQVQARQMGGTFFAVVNTFQNIMVEGTRLIGDSLMQATHEVTNFFGAFIAGESTLSEFGDAMADLAGNIANTFGDLFIKQGAGLVLINPAVGAGLIAAGLALKTLGGGLSAKGSANRGGGGARSGAAASSRDIAREINRSLRPSGDDGPMVTNIEVVIGGRSIQPEMVSIIDDIARQRRSRYLGRRMGA
jgi:hypothetical protein